MGEGTETGHGEGAGQPHLQGKDSDVYAQLWGVTDAFKRGGEGDRVTLTFKRLLTCQVWGG